MIMFKLFAAIFAFTALCNASIISAATLSWEDDGQALRAALWNEDYRTALRLLETEKARNLEITEQKLSSDDLFYVLDIEFQMAMAKGNGKLGDPCPHLKRVNDAMMDMMLQSRHSTEAEKSDLASEAITTEYNYSKLSRKLSRAIVDFDCTRMIMTSASAELAGTYYLRGVMETGSGLRLKADGSYEWFLSVGSMDLFSAGVWHRHGDMVQTIALPQSSAKEAATLGKVKPYLPLPNQTGEGGNFAIDIRESDGKPVEFGMMVYVNFPDGRIMALEPVKIGDFKYDYGRYEVTLSPADFEDDIEITFQTWPNEASSFSSDFRIRVQPGTIQEFIIKRQENRPTEAPDVMTIYAEDGYLKPDLFGKGVYVKSEPKKP